MNASSCLISFPLLLPFTPCNTYHTSKLQFLVIPGNILKTKSCVCMLCLFLCFFTLIFTYTQSLSYCIMPLIPVPSFIVLHLCHCEACNYMLCTLSYFTVLLPCSHPLLFCYIHSLSCSITLLILFMCKSLTLSDQ